MGKKVVIVVSMLAAFGLGNLYAAGLKIPPHYKPISGRCRPGKGYILGPTAPNYPSHYPTLDLWAFNGEVIGFTFEVHAKDGWKPWYNQPEGKPVVHGKGPPHYSQYLVIKKGPTAEECKAPKSVHGKSNQVSQ